MKIAILGAAGFIGRTAAVTLAARAEVRELLLVDYVVRDAKRLAKVLSPKCRWSMADVGRAPELARILDGVDAVASAVGPCALYEKEILSTCASKGVPAASIGDGALSPADRREIHDAFRVRGAAAVSGCGMMPGWTELLREHFLPGRRPAAGSGEGTAVRRFLGCRPDRFGGYAFFRRVIREAGREAAARPDTLPPYCWFAMGDDLFGLPPGRPSGYYQRISRGLGFLGTVGEELSAAFLYWLRGNMKPKEEGPAAVAGLHSGEGNAARSVRVEDARGRMAGELLAESAVRLAGREAGKGLLPLPALLGREDAERLAAAAGGTILVA